MKPPTLDAETVRLRPHRDADVDGIVEQATDPESQRWTTVPVPYSRAHAVDFLEHIRRGWRDDSSWSFAIADTGTDAYLGTVDVRPDGHGLGDLGFALRPSARGRGAMSTALRRLARWAFDPAGPDLEVLHWRALVGNWASRRAVWRVGFRVEGRVRGLCVVRGRRYDAWIGSLHCRDVLEPAHPWLRAPTLRGDRCVLRPFTESDADAVVEACTDPRTQHWLGALPRPYTKGHALGYVGSREDEHAQGTGLFLAAADPATDRCVGSFGLDQLDRDAGSGEIGYWVHPGARGQGVATESVRLLIGHAFAAREHGGLALRRLVLRAAAGNTASRRVAQAAGFRQAGVERSAERLGDATYDDLVRYELLAGDPR